MIASASSTDNLMANLASNVKLLRLAKGLSQEELAVKCRVCRATINRIEAGTRMPDFDLACLLADALGTTTDRLRKNLAKMAASA